MVYCTLPAGCEPEDAGTYEYLENAWQDTLEQIIDDSALSFAWKCIELNIPQPSIIGYELVDDSGEVIGEAEFAWVFNKVALLMPEQDESVAAFAKNGWTILRVDDEVPNSLFEGVE